MSRFRFSSLLAASLLWAQADEPLLFKTEVSLVKVDAKVTQRDGRNINDLTREDFVVFDEDISRPIAHFGRESEPLRLLLLLDVSGSMSRLLGEMSAKASEALRQLRPGDEVGVMLFASRSELMQPFTSDLKSIPEKIVNSVFKTALGQGTVLNEALVKAANYTGAGTSKGRRAILLVTDNEGARADAQDNDVLRALQDADAVLNAILVGGSNTARIGGRYQNPASAPPDVRRFVENTGGDVIADEDAGSALKRLISQIATRYSLEYPAPPASSGAFRRIRVELSPAAQRRYPGAVVQARTGYYVDSR